LPGCSGIFALGVPSTAKIAFRPHDGRGSFDPSPFLVHAPKFLHLTLTALGQRGVLQIWSISMRLSPFILVLAAILTSCAPKRGGVEEVVAMPRAQLYAELDTHVTALEQAVTAKPTETGTPPVPVKFDFAHDEGRHLRVNAVAGFRVVTLELWLEDGDDPAHTRLSANVAGLSNAEGIEASNVRFPVQARLAAAIAQANEGVRISALFGKGGANSSGS
jgi:hypothetical protein